MVVVALSRIAGAPARTPRVRRARRTYIPPLVRAGRRALLVLLAAPLVVRLLVGAILVVLMWSAVNWAYQVIRKPTELFFTVSSTLSKTPSETWRQYAPLFREHSTITISPELLAALAQVEGSGNPVARTYWRWQGSWNPFAVYRPASSAVGMYQITDPTFREAKRFWIVTSRALWSAGGSSPPHSGRSRTSPRSSTCAASGAGTPTCSAASGSPPASGAATTTSVAT